LSVWQLASHPIQNLSLQVDRFRTYANAACICVPLIAIWRRRLSAHRTAWEEAIHLLLKRGPAPPPVYQGQYDPKALFAALKVFLCQ